MDADTLASRGGTTRGGLEAMAERRFLDVLRDAFVGEPIEGDSGFVELRRIRERYHDDHVAPRVRAVIREQFADLRGTSEDVLEPLGVFFRDCLTETGSIRPRAGYPREDAGGRDVALCWQTRGLYYVKSDRLFRGREIEVDGFRFVFDVSGTEHRRSTEKRNLSYAFAGRREDGALVLEVRNTECGERTDIARIRRTIAESFDARDGDGRIPSERTLKRAVRMFERERESDWFLDPNARANLRERLEEWLSRELLAATAKEDASDLVERIRRLRALEKIALTAIDLVARFEDELVKIWNKPKFVLGSHYVVTLDRIAARDGGAAVLERLFANPGMERQLREWRELGMVDEDFTPEKVWVTDPTGTRLHGRYRYLPIDTRHFPDLEAIILSLFDHLDRELDGWLVHSDNYQALDTMLPKFRERVSCVYIDPPYNAPEAEIDYANRFRHGAWLGLMESRLRLAGKWLRPERAAFFVAIDDHEMLHLGNLMAQTFPDLELNTFVVVHHPQGSPRENVSRVHEYTFAAVTRGRDFLRVPRPPGRSDERPFMRTGTAINNFREGRPNSFYAVVVDPGDRRIVEIDDPPPPGEGYPVGHTPDGYVRVYPVDSQGRERVWRKTAATARRMLADGWLVCRRTRSGYAIREKTSSELVKPTSVWHDSRYNAGAHGSNVLAALFGPSTVFAYPKSIHAVKDFVGSATYDDPRALVLDFFAGSGTTGHAVIDLDRGDGGRRRYILVETAEYFHTVLLPRIKKVVFSDRWRNGKAHPEGRGISHFAKYFRLEQYEEVLRRAHYRDGDGPDGGHADYAFLRDPRVSDGAGTGGHVPVVGRDTDRDEPQVDLSRLYPDIDLAETISCLTGRWIRRIRPSPEDPAVPGTVEFEDGTMVDLRSPPWEMVRPLIWW